jgi:hypothetical protein
MLLMGTIISPVPAEPRLFHLSSGAPDDSQQHLSHSPPFGVALRLCLRSSRRRLKVALAMLLPVQCLLRLPLLLPLRLRDLHEHAVRCPYPVKHFTERV